MRLESYTDTDFARVFRTFLKADKNDPTTYPMPPKYEKFWGKGEPKTAKNMALGLYSSYISLWNPRLTRNALIQGF